MSPHSQTLRNFARKLSVLLMFRGAVRWTTLWFFVWGVVVLAARFAGVVGDTWLLAGLFGFLPLAIFAAAREWRRRVAFPTVRAAYDGLNQCGGVIMAEETADMTAWKEQLPSPESPVLRWRSGRSLGLLGMSAAFVLVTLSLPDHLALSAQHPLEIGKVVGDLRAEVQTLKEEKILEEQKAEELQKELARLKENASGLDPTKTWEALDHIKESNSDLARQAAQEAIAKTTSLTEAQTLASALDAAEQMGLDQATADRAAQDLAGMVKSAKLEEGLLKGQIPPELLAATNGLKPEDLAKLASALQFGKMNLGKSMTNLANLRLIDPKLLAQCQGAGVCRNTNALAEFMCQNTNCHSFCLAASLCYGRGGPGGGGGTGPMTWQNPSSEDGAKFKEEVLPPSTHLSDAQFVGVTRSAPELSGDDASAEHGALANAKGSGGSANTQVILPRHKQAVQRFFKREQ